MSETVSQHSVAFARLSKLAPVRAYAAGAPVHHRGDAPTHLTLIVSGRVHFGRTRPDGRPLADGVHRAGDWFGDIAMFADAPYPHDARTLEASELIRVPRARLDAALKDDPLVRDALYAGLARRLMYAFALLDDLRAGSGDGALRALLAHLAEPAPGGGRRVRATQSDLAAYLGRSRVTVGKHLKAMERAGEISLKYGAILLHP